MNELLEEEPEISNGALALALSEEYPEYGRDELLDLIELERPTKK